MEVEGEEVHLQMGLLMYLVMLVALVEGLVEVLVLLVLEVLEVKDFLVELIAQHQVKGQEVEVLVQ